MKTIYEGLYHKKDGGYVQFGYACQNYGELVLWANENLPAMAGEKEFELSKMSYCEAGYMFAGDDGEEHEYRGGYGLSDEVCSIRWCVEDLLHAMAKSGIELTDENVSRAMDLGPRLQHRSIEEGWETLGILLSMEF